MVYKQIPNADELRCLYWNEGLSTRALAKRYGTHQRALIQWMRKFEIPRRNRIQAVIKGCSKYVKIPFDGTSQDKAYMLGLTFADFHRRRHGYQIRIATKTTHPAFSKLFKDLFGNFTHLYERPTFRRETRKYGWELEVLLHPSFDFLLLPKHIPKWVLQNDGVFLHFLAGYADGEGILSILRNTKRYVAFLFCIASEDKAILRSIWSKLKNMGFHPFLRRLRKAGETNTFNGQVSYYRKDQWVLRLKRRREVIKLLEMIPIRHGEKIRKKQVMLDLRDKVHIKDVKNAVLKLRNEIRTEVTQYVRAAEEKYQKKKFSFLNISS